MKRMRKTRILVTIGAVFGGLGLIGYGLGYGVGKLLGLIGSTEIGPLTVDGDD